MRRPARAHSDSRGSEGPRPTAEPGEVVQGLRAGLAAIARREGDILRIAFAHALRGEVDRALRAASRKRIPTVELGETELSRLAGSAHHEGLCVVARPRAWTSTGELAEILVRGRGAAIALDRVRNPYNIGAILRSAAFFAVDAAILGAPAPHPGLPPTAVRVAEGGVEHLMLARTTDLADTLGRLRSRGVRIVGADGHATTSALDFAFARPTVLVMGNEREGLGDRIRAQCDAMIAVRGGGAVESLNVAVAAGLLLGQLQRRPHDVP